MSLDPPSLVTSQFSPNTLVLREISVQEVTPQENPAEHHRLNTVSPVTLNS